ncbi:MAG: ACDE family multidrug resistance protein [Kiritimatiellia bacterium]|jgi:ACDE family multidrug resistance protein
MQFSLPAKLKHHHINLAFLYFLAASAKTILLSLIPLGALHHYGSAQSVSVLYFVISVVGLFTSILIPRLIRNSGASGAIYMGSGAMIIAALLMLTGLKWHFAIGMALHMYGSLAMEIGLTLILLQRIPRESMAAFEPTRVIFQATSYMTGPWIGVALFRNFDNALPFLISMSIAGFLVVSLFVMKLHRYGTGEPTSSSTHSPFESVKHFVSQPRLRLSWFITLGRTAWWNVFFIYTPIYAVTTGLGEFAGAAIVSIGVAFVLSVHFWSWLGRKKGFRRMVITSFALSGISLVLLGLLDVPPLIGGALLVLTALTATPLDAAGNLAFLKFVRRRERVAMTGVFQTNRDASQLIPPGIFAVALINFELPVIFLLTGAGMLGLSRLARHLPKRF